MKTPRVLVLLAAGCEEIEAVTPIDVLRRAGVTVVAAGLTPGPLTASRGVRLLADVELDDVLDEIYDMVVLPGGLAGAEALAKDARVKRLIAVANEEKRWIAAICASPAVVLEAAGIIGDQPATGHPSLKERLPTYKNQRVVISGHLVTSQGAGTAMEFALCLVQILMGDAKALEIANAIVWND